jgi:lipoyl(octanoyl) transferase
MTVLIDANGLRVRTLGCQSYRKTWQAMSQFTDKRAAATVDELWLVEHNPVYTQGRMGKPEHILKPSDIPIVKTDRGGQITYHGPGQLVCYPLIDLRRRHLGVRDLVTLIETWVIEWLSSYGLKPYTKPKAPGVYIAVLDGDAKIASLGLRIRRGCSFHGVAINIAMDLTPFDNINPCGYAGLMMTQLSEHVTQVLPPTEQLHQELVLLFAKKIAATEIHYVAKL